MNAKARAVILGAVLILTAFAAATAAQKPVNPFFGHVSLTDVRGDALDPVVLRPGAKAPEPAVLNLQVGPGDVIRSSKERRVEIQFDNATIVRLDTDTELKIETIMAQGLSTANQMSNLVLAKGRLFVMYKQYNNREIFQVLTPKAALKLKHNSVGMITLTPEGTTDVLIKYGKAQALYGADLKAPKSLDIAAKERAVFTLDNRFAVGEPLPVDDFEAWNKAVNDDFEALHEGKALLPKPVQKLMPAVVDWAARYNHYGEWLYDDYFGYVWRPFYNDTYPWGNWRPYYAGRWSYYRNSMFWVGSEPWGWVPYHLGLWQWNSKRGWYWIPGSAFAPAWVDWAFFGGYWSWRPWSVWDWGFRYYDMMGWTGWGGFNGYPYWTWRYMPWGAISPWTFPVDNTTPYAGNRNPRGGAIVRKPSAPDLPMPGEYKAGLKALMGDLKKGDPAALESFRAQGGFANVADRATLMAPDVGSKTRTFESVRAEAANRPKTDPLAALLAAPPANMTWPAYFASLEPGRTEADVRGGGAGAVVGPDRGDPRGGQGRTGLAAPRAAAMDRGAAGLRKLDWNPDVTMARRMGVSLQYLSAANMIYCPELNLDSRNSRYNPDNNHAGSMINGGVGGAGSSSSGNWAGTGGTAGSAGSSAGSAGSSTGTSTSAGSGGGHIK